VIWVHAPSVGEFIASRDLIAELLAKLPAVTILVTTVTATGAAAVARANIPRVIHQFFPADVPVAVGGFLDHWRPEMAVFVEADIWPHIVTMAAEQGVRLALVNARPSRTRRRLRRTMGALLSRFALVTAQDAGVAEGIVALGLPPDRVHAVGDLKADAAPLPDVAEMRLGLAGAIAARPVWAAVSTHEADEAEVLTAQAALIRSHAGAMLILVPRHPERVVPLRAACEAAGLAVAQRSRGEVPGEGTAVYLADTIGETGIFFRLSRIVFLGGSFGEEGGHNPFEPLRLGAALLHGPKVRHFAQAYATLDAIGAAVRVADGQALGAAVAVWLDDPEALERAITAGTRALGEMQGARERTLALLLALVDAGG
jgi:3-deoxy-D-manno-octulosonic-acid transferase